MKKMDPQNTRAAGGGLIREKRENPRISTLKLALTWLLLLLIAMFFVQQRIDFTKTERRVRNLIIEKRRIMSAILPLKLEERYLTNYSVIEEAAIENHQLQIPRKSQMITVRVNAAGQAIDPEPNP